MAVRSNRKRLDLGMLFEERGRREFEDHAIHRPTTYEATGSRGTR